MFHQDIELLKRIIAQFFYKISIHTLENMNIWLTEQNLREINVRGEEAIIKSAENCFT